MSENKQAKRRRIRWPVVVVGLLAVAGVIAGTIELDWYTIDSGGGTVMTGGDIEIVGVIGQPDAGVMTGGDIEITGGFLFGVEGPDCNNNGVPDDQEIVPPVLFVAARHHRPSAAGETGRQRRNQGIRRRAHRFDHRVA